MIFQESSEAVTAVLSFHESLITRYSHDQIVKMTIDQTITKTYEKLKAVLKKKEKQRFWSVCATLTGWW